MAAHISNIFYFFVILVLVASVGNMGLGHVDGAYPCQKPLGACGPMGDCDRKCKAAHSGGEGSCDLGLCTCYYNCPSPPSPPEPNYCKIGLGRCDAQCNKECCKAKCARQYKQGAGDCDTSMGIGLCNCIYIC